MDFSKLTDKQLEVAIKVAEAAEKQGLNPDFVLPMVMQESGFDPKAVSKAGAVGVMQLMPDTAKSLKVDPANIDENIDGGMRLLKELVTNKKIGDDPYKVLAAYNTSTETRNKFLESGDLSVLPDETINHMLKISEFYGGDLPSVSYKKQEEQAAPEAAAADVEVAPADQEVGAGGTEPARMPRMLAGAALGVPSAVAAGSAATALAKGRIGLDAVQQIAKNYPEIMNDLKSGKSPAAVINDFFKAKTAATGLPPAQGPLSGDPAGGRMTQNWVASQDAEGRYTDVGLKARDQAEAHQMKRAAMAAEDKIRQIAPEMRADPNRANLLIPQSAGRGPSPRFGGTPSAAIPSAAPVSETPSMFGNLKNIARHYTPYLKWPVMGGLTGFNIGQGAADVYNRVQEKRPGEAVASALGTAASTAAPFVSGAAAGPLSVAGAAIPLYLSASDRLRYLQKHPEAHEAPAVVNGMRFGPLGEPYRD